MSVSICYRPVPKTEDSFHGGTSEELQALKTLFPDGHITDNDIALLRAMHIASRSKFYEEVIEAVERHKEIEFWGQW